MRLTILTLCLLVPSLLAQQSGTSPFTSIPAPRADELHFDTSVEPFQAIDLIGKTWTESDFKGHVTIIGMWATSCLPCRAEHPQLEALYRQIKATGSTLQLLTVATDSNPKSVIAYMNEKSLHFPVLAGQGPALTPEKGEIPAWWIVDAQGRRSGMFHLWSIGRIVTEAERLTKSTQQ